VVGVGIGTKVINGIDTLEDCVRVYVAQKAENTSQLAASEIVPEEIARVQTDVIGAGRTFATRPNIIVQRRSLTSSATNGERPTAKPGSSIGPLVTDMPNVNQMLSGTLGAVLQDVKGAKYALSANHVLSVNGRIKGAKPVHSPSPEDDLHPPDGARDTVIARAEPIAVPLKRSGSGAGNRVDCAIVQLLDNVDVDPTFPGGVSVTGIAAPERGMSVMKYGKRTGWTSGRIIDVQADILMDYSFGNFRFVDQILIEGANDVPFAADGDSGSVILNEKRQAVGLLFGPVGLLTAACPMPAVIQELSQLLGCDLRFAPPVQAPSTSA
jgi:hypothetical protein